MHVRVVESQSALITAQVKRTKVPVIHNNGAQVGRDASSAGAEYRLAQDTYGTDKIGEEDEENRNESEGEKRPGKGVFSSVHLGSEAQ